MRKIFKICFFPCLIISSLFTSTSLAGLIYQDFEIPIAPSESYGWGFPDNDVTVIAVSRRGNEPVHWGGWSWKVTSSVNWGGTGIKSQVNLWHFNLDTAKNDRLAFYIYGLPQNGTDNNVGVQFFDHGNYHDSGFNVWTTKTAHYGNWTELYVLFSQLPPDFNLADVDKVQFINYWPGTYYLDDIASIRRDREYQAFEPEQRSGSTESEYGWKWNEVDTVGFSGNSESVHEGLHSWKLMTPVNWAGTGIQSQEKRILQNGTAWDQTFWHVDLEPRFNDRLTFWVYALPENGMDNNLAVQFYDNGAHFTDDTKVAAWTSLVAKYGTWTRLTVPFSVLPSDFNLRDINKLQFQHYWPGTYFIDDIRAGPAVVEINKTGLSQGRLQWQSVPDTNYFIQESTQGPEGPWQAFWSSIDHAIWQPDLPLDRLVKAWYRIQWSDGTLPAYNSDWSEVAKYNPPFVLIDVEQLKQGILKWNAVVFATLYEVDSAPAKSGPWSNIFTGSYPANGLSVVQGIWYRVRAKKDNGEVSVWSPLQKYEAGKGFICAVGTDLREEDGNGEVITLRGLNLGSYLLLEKWMSGIGAGDAPNIEDEWTLRNELTARFGAQGCEQLYNTFRDSYIQDIDFDNLLRLGINLVRLPVYYRIVQDENGQWITKPNGDIDFDRLDRVVNSCAERGIYVLLDLHGAPGSQSNEFHTGRANYNKLFENSTLGEQYRDQTVELWRGIAEHYKDNPYVMGYDLLNEPVGAPTPQALWNLYDRLYQAIRVVDTHHLVVMEGIWFWDSLPLPQSMGWSNVLYQFHYYLWGKDDDIKAHRDYIDALVADSEIKQAEYQVPVLIGEFTGFSQRAIWEYYLANFNRKNWSWSFWSDKFHTPYSNWGLYTHTGYGEELPKIRAQQEDGTSPDSFEVLQRKLSKYDTLERHTLNFSLAEIIRKFLPQKAGVPFIKSLEPDIVQPGSDFVISGENFGASQGNGQVVFAGDTPFTVVSWSDNSIRASFPSSETRLFGYIIVRSENGESNVMPLYKTPRVTGIAPEKIYTGQAITITGVGFGFSQGEVQFSAIPCNQQQGECKYGMAVITSWSPTVIKCIVPLEAQSGLMIVRTSNGKTAKSVEIIRDLPPVLSHIGNKSVSEGQALSFTITANDPEGNPLTFSTSALPQGATFLNQKFSWTPGYNQAGTYQVTFTVSDGQLSASETITITVNNVPLTISGLKDSPDPFSPNKDYRLDTTTISGSFNHTAAWQLNIRNSANTLMRSFQGNGTSLSQVWDGKNSSHAVVRDGRYTYTLSAKDTGNSSVSQSGTITVDTVDPKLTKLKVSPNPFWPRRYPTTISFTLSESCTVTVRIYSGSAQVKTLMLNKLLPAGNNSVTWDGKNTSGSYMGLGNYTIYIWVEDIAANRTSPYPIKGTVSIY